MGELTGNINPSFWRDKKVYLTGHTGFKGSWLSLLLLSMGSKVKGYSLLPPTSPSLFEEAKIDVDMNSEIGDIRDLEKLKKSIKDFKPDVIIHLAAQPLVRLSYKEPIETYTTNVIGTANVLEAARDIPNLRSIVSVTTDKCYENKEWEWAYRENEPMGGHDPYSSSKGCAELVTAAYRNSFFNNPNMASLASARAGNVIGGGDWADDRLIPDILRAFEKGEPVIIRNPMSTRPWQHVLEPLSGYLVLAQALYEKGDDFAEAWNFGPDTEDEFTVNWIVEQMAKSWGEDAKWKVDKDNHPHEANHLKLNCKKANTNLNWYPKWNLSKSLKKIIEWHKPETNLYSINQICLSQIDEYSRELVKNSKM